MAVVICDFGNFIMLGVDCNKCEVFVESCELSSPN
jgi:hypothetical protein